MRNWYSIQNKGNTAEILIYDVIGKDPWSGEGVGAKDFIQELNALKGVDSINLRINSPGGAVFEGTAIHNALANHPATINVAIDGMALSAASFIAMAGDNVKMAENAMMMIHDPWGGVIGTAEDMRKQADMMDKAKQNIILTYQNKVKLSDTALSDMMSQETWMTGQEAKDFGFVDEVTAPMKMAASYDKRILNAYHHVPDEVKEMANANNVTTFTIKAESADTRFSNEQIRELVEKIEEANKSEPENTGRSIDHLKKEIEITELQ